MCRVYININKYIYVQYGLYSFFVNGIFCSSDKGVITVALVATIVLVVIAFAVIMT